jgi:hypothetical protein
MKLKYLFCLLLALVVLVPASPAIQQIPQRDAGVFMSVGQEILSGGLPYRDIWDHKPPLIFYWNALGLLISGGSLWGPWILEVISLTLAACLLLNLMLKMFGSWSAWLALISGSLSLAYVLHGGNYTEEAALPFQAAVLGLSLEAFSKQRSWRSWFLIGIFSGIIIAFKQTAIGICLAVGVILFVSVFSPAWRQRLSRLVAYGAGALALMSGICLAFYAAGGFKELVDQAILYNMAYSNLGPLERLNSMRHVLSYINSVPGFVLALAAWVAALLIAVLGQGRRIAAFLRLKAVGKTMLVTGVVFSLAVLGVDFLKPERRFDPGLGQYIIVVLCLIEAGLGLVLIRRKRLEKIIFFFEHSIPKMDGALYSLTVLLVLAFPFELFLIGLSARNYVYYYITIFPTVTVLIAWLLYWVQTGFNRAGERAIGKSLALGLFALTLITPLMFIQGQLKPGKDEQLAAAIEFVAGKTQPGDTVQVWGAESMVNFLAKRPAPTPYYYLYPLYMRGYMNGEKADQFIKTFITEKPELILDTRDKDTPFIAKGDLVNCQPADPEKTEYFKPVLDFVCQNYILEGTVGPENWWIYRRKK